jgi:outer membrane protein assembly factor BamB
VSGGDRLYFVESRAPKVVQNELGRIPMSEFLTGPNAVVALDVHTGKELWRVPISLEDCRHIIYATYAQDKLIISGNRYIDRKLWYFYKTLNAADGQTVWTASHNSGYDIGGDHGEQNRIPTVIGNTIYTHPVAYDLQTGVQRTDWQFDRLGHGCGNTSASADCIFWRGGNPWQWNLTSGEKPKRVNNVTRPGCFINMLPVGGLLLIPEASSGCTCSFPLQTSLAYVPEGAE